LSKILHQDKIDFIALDNLSTGKATRIPSSIPFFQGDIRDIKLLEDIFKEFKISKVINLAGLKSPEASFDNRSEYFEVNSQAVFSLLQVAARFNVDTFIQSSSSSVYGDSVEGILDETVAPKPVSPYGESKLLAERHVEHFIKLGKIRGINLRYFNVVGAIDSSLKDQSLFNLFPKTLNRIKSGLPPIIYGDDYPTPDGTCIRDYVHVADLANVHILAATAIARLKDVSVLNVGLGKGNSVKQIIELFIDYLESDLNPEYAPRRQGDPAVVVAGTNLFRKLFDFPFKFEVSEMVRSSL
jgi:UDP-glucose 4-epimerase